MKNSLLVALLVSVCISLRFASFSQDTITAQQVINRFIKLSLNKLSADKLKVIGAKAIGTNNGDSLEAYVLKMPPDKLYMKLTIKEKGSTEIIYNDGRAIVRANGASTSITDSIMLDEMKANAFLIKEMAYEALGYTMKLLPPGALEGDVYKVELVSPIGSKTYKYYDKTTGYLTKSIQADGSTSFFTEYYTANGFTTSRKEKDISTTGSISEVYIQAFLINPAFDPSLFDF